MKLGLSQAIALAAVVAAVAVTTAHAAPLPVSQAHGVLLQERSMVRLPVQLPAALVKRLDMTRSSDQEDRLETRVTGWGSLFDVVKNADGLPTPNPGSGSVSGVLDASRIVKSSQPPAGIAGSSQSAASLQLPSTSSPSVGQKAPLRFSQARKPRKRPLGATREPMKISSSAMESSFSRLNLHRHNLIRLEDVYKMTDEEFHRHKIALRERAYKNPQIREEAREVLNAIEQRRKILKELKEAGKPTASSSRRSETIGDTLPMTTPPASTSTGGERVMSPPVRPHGTGVPPSTALSLGMGSSSTPAGSTLSLKPAMPVNHDDPLSLKLGLPDHDPQPDVSLKLATPGL